MAGSGSTAGGSVPFGLVTGRSLFTFPLRWISHLSSSLAVLFLWLSWPAAEAVWLVAAAAWLVHRVLSGPATVRSLVTLTLRWIIHLSSTHSGIVILRLSWLAVVGLAVVGLAVGTGGTVGGRVPSGPATGRSLFTVLLLD